MTDEQPNDDDGEKGRQEEQGQGGSKAIYARYGNRMQAMTEQGSEKYTVHNGRIMTSETIKHLKNHAIVHIVDTLPGGGKKKGQKKQNKGETSSSESDTLADMLFELIQKGNHQDNNLFQILMQMDEETVQEIMSRMKRAIAVEGEALGLHSSSFEAVRTMDTRKQANNPTGGKGTARWSKSRARENNAGGGTAGT